MSLQKFSKLLGRLHGSIIGMVHLQPLPGSPRSSKSVNDIKSHALKEAEIYLENGVDSIMIENMHDIPYLQARDVGPEVVAAMTTVAWSLRQAFSEIPMGIQILTAANKEALAVAKCTGLNYIRAEGFVFSHVGDEGWIDSCAGNLLRYRKEIDAENVLVFADIKKKHSSHAVTNDISVAETARAAEFFLADGVVVTGTETGVAPNSDHIAEVKNAVNIPVLVGSGVTTSNVEQFVNASALIVGSHFKHNGLWSEEVNPAQVKSFMEKVKQFRS